MSSWNKGRKALGLAVAVAAWCGTVTTAAVAQGKGKHYAVSSDRAIVVTRTVLERQGYDVVRIDHEGSTQVVYYRRGNMGRGKGKGRLERLVIRTVDRRVVFEDTPPELLVDIDVHLKL